MENEKTGRERRRHTRYKANVDGRILIAGRSVSCQVHNISAGGALIEAALSLRINDEAQFEIAGFGTLGARVVRVTSTAVALVFDGEQEESLDSFIKGRAMDFQSA